MSQRVRKPLEGGFLELQLVKCVPRLLSTDTLDCTYHCNQTSPPMSQSNKRKAAPREVKKPLATVPPPAIYILSKCHNQLPQIRKGTRDKSDLAQPPSQALSHQVSNSDGGWFTGVSL